MLRITELKLPLDHDEAALPAAIVARLGIKPDELTAYSVAKRSYDARKRGAIVLIYSVDVDTPREAELLARLQQEPGRSGSKVIPTPDTTYKFVAQAPVHLPLRPLVVGMGPCGLFAGLVLAQMGFKPIILERGKAVRERTVDTFGLWRKKVLDPESNVQFGEGGAGTFSDGKLYSQISDKLHHGRKVLAEFVAAGAPEEILYVSKPHIGTFRLVSMVERMRATIESLGGEIRFGSRVDDIHVETGADGVRHLRGVTLANGEQLRADHVVLALGHSARDTFAMLHARGVFLEAKPFSVGFRIEHPQSLIDQARFGPQAGHELLGAADYKLVHHASNGRSVYSFCMCPGGTVVAATSEPGRVVTNGMSQYSRNERNANAGIVVGITPEDYTPHGEGPLAGIALQRHWESQAYALGGGDYLAPAQRVGQVDAYASALARVDAVRCGAAVVHAGRDIGFTGRSAAALRHRRHPRGAARVRAADPGLRDGGRAADRRGDTHFVTAAHHPRRGRSQPQHPRPVPGRRRRGLRGRHPVGRRGWHQDRRSSGAQHPSPHLRSATGASRVGSR